MDFITVMEWIGTVAFAVSGAVVAIERELDYYGICFMAIITAIGGGIIRDVLINQSLPASLANPMYAIVSLLTAAAVIFFYKKIDKISHLVSVADGFGLAAFTAIGSQVAVRSGHGDNFCHHSPSGADGHLLEAFCGMSLYRKSLAASDEKFTQWRRF